MIAAAMLCALAASAQPAPAAISPPAAVVERGYGPNTRDRAPNAMFPAVIDESIAFCKRIIAILGFGDRPWQREIVDQMKRVRDYDPVEMDRALNAMFLASVDESIASYKRNIATLESRGRPEYREIIDRMKGNLERNEEQRKLYLPKHD